MKLEARNLSFSYGKRKILDDISFAADEGEMVAILGRNGSGKTTLFRLLLGFLSPESGKILIDGKDLEMLGRRERAMEIAYIPQSSAITYSYSVIDMVLMGRSPSLSLFERPGKEDRDKAENVLGMLGIAELRDRSINAISGGERQLVLIARALTQEANVLLLDEPTSSLDYSNQLLVMETVSSLREKGYSIVFSTHSPEQALMNADKVMILSDGKIPFIGRPDELMDGEILENLYSRKLCIRCIDTGESRRIICIPR